MLTKKQKNNLIQEGIEELKKGKSLIFIDFSGLKGNDLANLRNNLKEIESTMKVIKKRLLRIIFERKRIDFNPEIFESQLGTIFSSAEIYSVAAVAGKLENLKILGGFDLEKKEFIKADLVIKLSKLPSKKVLLGQLVGTIVSPLRAFLYVLTERSKKIA
ncbi:MAG: 50S ribosomal protein L10 [Candidatus Liptonbacteria bacterium]|nr:50S ribosomal protein L10 [Candidatus Liptonbacteria bacterium]